MKFTKTMVMNIIVKYNGEICDVDNTVEVKRFPFTNFDLKKRLLAQRSYAEALGFKTVGMDKDSFEAVGKNGDFITVLYVNK